VWHLQPRGYRAGGLNRRSPPGDAPPQIVLQLEKAHQLERVLRRAQEKTCDLLHTLVAVQKMDYPAAWELATKNGHPFRSKTPGHHPRVRIQLPARLPGAPATVDLLTCSAGSTQLARMVVEREWDKSIHVATAPRSSKCAASGHQQP
jgi:hypothetical protein